MQQRKYLRRRHHDIYGGHPFRRMDWRCTQNYVHALAQAEGVPLRLSWRVNGFFGELYRIGAYPKARESISHVYGPDYPQKEKSFRCFFEFPNPDAAMKAYFNLVLGTKTLTDYLDNYSGNPEYKQCI